MQVNDNTKQNPELIKIGIGRRPALQIQKSMTCIVVACSLLPCHALWSLFNVLTIFEIVLELVSVVFLVVCSHVPIIHKIRCNRSFSCS